MKTTASQAFAQVVHSAAECTSQAPHAGPAASAMQRHSKSGVRVRDAPGCKARSSFDIPPLLSSQRPHAGSKGRTHRVRVSRVCNLASSAAQAQRRFFDTWSRWIRRTPRSRCVVPLERPGVSQPLANARSAGLSGRPLRGALRHPNDLQNGFSPRCPSIGLVPSTTFVSHIEPSRRRTGVGALFGTCSDRGLRH